jgi:hypothetical protein
MGDKRKMKKRENEMEQKRASYFSLENIQSSGS